MNEAETLLPEVRGGLRGLDSITEELLLESEGGLHRTAADSRALSGRDAWIHRLEHLLDELEDEDLHADDAPVVGSVMTVWKAVSCALVDSNSSSIHCAAYAERKTTW